MAARRHSRTPMTLTKDQQTALILAADKDEALRNRLEYALGIKLAELTFQEKLNAMYQLQEQGFALGSLAGAMRGFRDFDRETELRQYGVAAEDRLATLEEQVRMLQEAVDEKDQRIAQLTAGRMT